MLSVCLCVCPSVTATSTPNLLSADGVALSDDATIPT